MSRLGQVLGKGPTTPLVPYDLRASIIIIIIIIINLNYLMMINRDQQNSRFYGRDIFREIELRP